MWHRAICSFKIKQLRLQPFSRAADTCKCLGPQLWASGQMFFSKSCDSDSSQFTTILALQQAPAYALAHSAKSSFQNRATQTRASSRSYSRSWLTKASAGHTASHLGFMILAASAADTFCVFMMYASTNATERERLA
jgi:hypothetical protein